MAEYIIDERLLFKNGKQKELINFIKNKTKLSWKELSKRIGVSDITLRIVLRNERTTIARSTFRKLLKICGEKPDKYQKNIIKLLPKNWGQSKGGRIAIDKIRKCNKIRKPDHSTKEFAEFIGILLGDGHVSKKGIDIALDSRVDREYSVYVYDLLYKLFEIEPKIFKTKNCLHIRLNSILLAEYLNGFGIKHGDKIQNQTTIPEYIQKDTRLLAECIRGIVDTDGGIYLKQKPYQRAIVEVTNFNLTLLNDVRKALSLLGYTPSAGGHAGKNVRIQRQNEVIRFVDEIGFSNLKNSKKANRILGKRLWSSGMIRASQVRDSGSIPDSRISVRTQ